MPQTNQKDVARIHVQFKFSSNINLHGKIGLLRFYRHGFIMYSPSALHAAARCVEDAVGPAATLAERLDVRVAQLA